MILQARLPVSRGHGLGEGVHQEEVGPVVPPAPHSLGSCTGGRVTRRLRCLRFTLESVTRIIINTGHR